MQIIEVDLARQIPDIAIANQHREVLIVVMWGYCPIGLVKILARDKLAISSKSLEAELYETLGWELWSRRISGVLDSVERLTNSGLQPISVAVCTRDQAVSLKRCLDSLSRLDYPHYEVLVVDNASIDSSIRQVVEGKGARYTREEIPGLDWARNRAIREAKHDIVAFIDDDVIASKGWLYGIAKGFLQPETMAVTGLVLPAELETPAQYKFESYGGMSKGFSPFTIRKEDLGPERLLWASGWGVGANMAFRRNLFERIGNFDPALDVGTATRGGGDIEFFYRTVAAGYTLQYEPMALTYHVHRRKQEALMRQIADNGRSFPAFLITVSRNHHDQKAAVIDFCMRHWLWGSLLKRGLLATLRGDWQTTRFVAAELQGSISSFSGYREAQRTARMYRQVEQVSEADSGQKGS